MKFENIKNIPELQRGQFIVNVSGIIFDPKTKKILLGKRENDPYIKGITWCFPGGRPKEDDELEDTLKREIQEKTGVKVESLGPIFARIIPERKEFLTIFYLCEPVGGKLKPGKKFVDVKWIDISELGKYHKIPKVHPKLKEYIENLK